jgi:NitT/TauT family transport system permease protein
MKRGALERWMQVVAPLSLLVLWELLVRTHILDARFFPAPSEIASTFGKFASSGDLASNTWSTLVRIVVGSLVGGIPGTILGLAMGTNRFVRAYFDPVIALLYPIPKIAILPLIIFIFGLGEQSKWVLVAIGVFFLMVINTESGVRQIDKVYLDVARAYRIRPWAFYTRVLLPGALPNIMSGVKLSIGLAIVLCVAAEFTAAKSGLGYTIFNSQQLLDIDTLYVALVAVSVLGFVMTLGLDMLDRALLPWIRK